MPSDLPNEILHLLAAFPWDEKIPRLLMHASLKAKNKRWRTVFDGQLPDGKEIQDIVYQAIEKVLSGERKWNPKEQPDLFHYLQGIIDSDLSHLARSLENRVLMSEADVDCRSGEDNASWLDTLPSPALDPELLQIAKEDDARGEAFFYNFYVFLDGKPVLQGMIECIEEGIDKSADMAKKLGIPVNEIYNASKQLRRKLEEFRKTLENIGVHHDR